MAGSASQTGPIERLTKTAHQKIEGAADAASSAVDHLGEKAEALYSMPQDWVESARDYVRERPLSAVCITFAAGYLFRLLSRG
jgi:ElaB/YqjD/DUF883 family membrane-anchored ribosome-binding protein